MFDENSLKKIDTKYFNIILMDDRDITIQSRNTGHYWYLHCTEYPMEQSLIIFHKHFFVERDAASHLPEHDRRDPAVSGSAGRKGGSYLRAGEEPAGGLCFQQC